MIEKQQWDSGMKPKASTIIREVVQPSTDWHDLDEFFFFVDLDELIMFVLSPFTKWILIMIIMSSHNFAY